MRDLQTGARRGQMYQICGFQQVEYPALEMRANRRASLCIYCEEPKIVATGQDI